MVSCISGVSQYQRTDENNRRKQRHAQQFDDGGNIARLIRNRIARPHDLSHIVDRTAQEKPALLGIQPQPIGQNGIGDHRNSRQNSYRNDGERQILFAFFRFGQD